MFERFTDRARRAVVLAEEEAREFQHNYIDTEHILLGLLHEGEGVAAQALGALGISLEAVRSQVQEIIGQGPQRVTGHLPFNPRTKKVLELSLREALQLGHNYIGTEHLLLALLREGEGIGPQIIVKLGSELTQVRQKVIETLSGYQPQARQSEKSEVENCGVEGMIREIVRDEINRCISSLIDSIPASAAEGLDGFLTTASWAADLSGLLRTLLRIGEAA